MIKKNKTHYFDMKHRPSDGTYYCIYHTNGKIIVRFRGILRYATKNLCGYAYSICTGEISKSSLIVYFPPSRRKMYLTLVLRTGL